MALRSLLRWTVALAILALVPSVGQAQLQSAAGVVVDADNVLRVRTYEDPTGELARERFNAAKASLNPQVAVPSNRRCISLNRLEKAIEQQLAEGKQPTEEMK